MSSLLTLIQYFLCLLLVLQAGAADRLERQEHYPPSRLEARSKTDVRLVTKHIPCCTRLRILTISSSNIVRGLLRSNKILQLISSIPCDVIQILENDADEASNFLSQLESGQVPTLIENLPQEVFDAFQPLVGIFETLPSELVNAAEAAVTDAATIFNDIGTGAIVDDIEQIPGAVVSLVTEEWGDFTSALVDGWDAATDAVGCLFKDCPVSTAASGGCLNNAASTTTGLTTTNVQPVQSTVFVPTSTVNVILPATPIQTSTDELYFDTTASYDYYTTVPYDYSTSDSYVYYTTAPSEDYTTAPSDDYSTAASDDSTTAPSVAYTTAPSVAYTTAPPADDTALPPGYYTTAPDNSSTSTAINIPVSANATGGPNIGASTRLLPTFFMLDGSSKVGVFLALGLLTVIVSL